MSSISRSSISIVDNQKVKHVIKYVVYGLSNQCLRCFGLGQFRYQNQVVRVVTLLAIVLMPSLLCDIASGEEMTIEQAVKMLVGEDSIEAGEAALWLGDHDGIDKNAIRALVNHLGDERDAERYPNYVPYSPPTVGDYVVIALQELDSSNVVPLVIKFLEDTDNHESRVRCLEVLRRQGKEAKASIPTVSRLITEDEDALIRWHAVATLDAVSQSQRESLVVLRKAIRDENSDVKAAAIRAIGNVGADAKVAVPDLIALLESEELRTMMISAHSGGWIPLRIDAAVSLGKIGPEASDALPKLREMLNEDYRMVQRGAAFAHAAISGDRAPGLDFLLAQLDKSRDDGVQTADYLRDLSHHAEFREPIFEAFQEALKNDRGMVRLTAIQAVAAMKPADAASLIRPLAENDPDKQVREVAEEELRKLLQIVQE